MGLFLDPRFFLFIAGTLVLHWILLRSANSRTHLIWITSVLFLAALHPLFAAIALGAATLVHLSAKPGRSRPLLLLLSFSLAILAMVKAAPWLIGRLASGTWLERYFLAPLGISYFIFRLLQYAADRYRGTLTDTSWPRLMAFLFFFPALPAGPIDTFQNFYGQRNPQWDWDRAAQGLRRILTGYFKKLFLVSWLFEYAFGDFTRDFLSQPSLALATYPPASPLAFVILMFLYAFFDLSAYTDIAVGLGGLFGYRLPENFDKPFLRTNLADFWRSWHISLSHWCRNQVYFPVLGVWRKPWIATYASMLTLGLWHQISWNWVAWAGYHASGLVAYAKWRRWRPWKDRPALDSLVGIPLTLLFVALGYAFVTAKDLSSAWSLFAACLTPWPSQEAG